MRHGLFLPPPVAYHRCLTEGFSAREGKPVLTWIPSPSSSSPFTDGTVFRASRFSRGNRLFPTQVAVTPTSVVHYTPHWIGAHQHSIHMAHIASVRVDSRMLFADVFIETTGGTGGIRCSGHRKGDADLMKQQIERHQSEYYRSDAPHTRSPIPS
jgi:hypothetical protein